MVDVGIEPTTQKPMVCSTWENLKSLFLWMVGIEPTTQKPTVLPTTPFVKDFSGVLVRLTTCKRLTNSLPKLSLITNVCGNVCGNLSVELLK